MRKKARKNVDQTKITHFMLGIVIVLLIIILLAILPLGANRVPIIPDQQGPPGEIYGGGVFSGMEKCGKDEICTGVIYYKDTRDISRDEKIQDILKINKYDLVVFSAPGYEGSKGPIANYLDNNVTLLYYDSFAERYITGDSPCCPKKDWNRIDQNENWFLHNNTRQRWTHPSIENFWMNTSNPNYRTHVALLIENVTKFDPKFDGVFIDESVGTYDAWINYGLGIPWARPPPAPYTQTQYEQGVILTAQKIKQQAGNKIIFTNGATPLFMPYVDGGMIEDFAVKTNKGDINQMYYPESGSPGTNWIDHINNLNNSLLNNRISMVQTDYWGILNHTDRQKLFNFSFTSYLLGKNPTSYAVYSFSGPQGNVQEYYPEYDIDTGRSLGTYYKTSSKVYVREYANVRVAVNPSNDFRVLFFGQQTYWKMDGTPVRNILILANHSGAVLFRSPP